MRLPYLGETHLFNRTYLLYSPIKILLIYDKNVKIFNQTKHRFFQIKQYDFYSSIILSKPCSSTSINSSSTSTKPSSSSSSSTSSSCNYFFFCLLFLFSPYITALSICFVL